MEEGEGCLNPPSLHRGKGGKRGEGKGEEGKGEEGTGEGGRGRLKGGRGMGKGTGEREGERGEGRILSLPSTPPHREGREREGI